MPEKYTKAEVVFKYRKPNAVLISYQDEDIWIPRSLLSYRCDSLVERLNRNDEFTIELYEWKAMELGM